MARDTRLTASLEPFGSQHESGPSLKVRLWTPSIFVQGLAECESVMFWSKPGHVS